MRNRMRSATGEALTKRQPWPYIKSLRDVLSGNKGLRDDSITLYDSALTNLFS